MQDSDDGVGTHWLGYFNDPKDKYIMYFDSFGVEPPEEIEKWLKSTKKDILYNTSQIQNIKSVLCGYYVIYFIDSLLSGEDYLDVVNVFSDDGDPKFQNDKKLMESVDVKTGEGIRDIFNKVKTTVKNAFDALVNGKRKGLSPSFRKTLRQHGEKDIVQITIVRKPVERVLKSIINLITLGKFNQQMKSLNYDDVFHLSAVLKLSDGTQLFLEKNAVAELKPFSGNHDGSTIDVNMKDSIKLKKFIEDTYNRIGERQYVDYSAENLNCQKFILDHLETFKLSNKKIELFIMQDASQLLSKDPNVFKALKAVTDLGALSDVVIQGRGLSDEVKKFFSELFNLFKPSSKQPNSQAEEIKNNRAYKRRDDIGKTIYDLIKTK